jgi:hypothetical protein
MVLGIPLNTETPMEGSIIVSGAGTKMIKHLPTFGMVEY